MLSGSSFGACKLEGSNQLCIMGFLHLHQIEIMNISDLVLELIERRAAGHTLF